MTREEATKIIKECKEKGFKYTFYTVEEYHTALDMAIKALEQEPCPDAISRQAAIDAVAFGITYATGINMETGEVSHPFAESNQELRKAIHRICELPPVNPQPKTGHWIRQTDDYHDYYECEHCGIAVGLDDIKNYCPNCGARMFEPQETETWNGYHGQITAPKGTFERIFNDADDENDI